MSAAATLVATVLAIAAIVLVPCSLSHARDGVTALRSLDVPAAGRSFSRAIGFIVAGNVAMGTAILAAVLL